MLAARGGGAGLPSASATHRRGRSTGAAATALPFRAGAVGASAAAAADEEAQYVGVGRRKKCSAVARLVPGTGQVVINGRGVEEYLQSNPDNIYSVIVPLETLGLEGRYDVHVRARGGGKTGQAQASRLAISKALASMDPEENRPPLKREGLLTTDDRRKERKKPALHGARRTPQYSKR